MLQHLSIKNYALIDAVEINFQNGLNLITGETGAGKSIILGALSLILGQRAESKYFYSQQKKCIIEGHFNLRKYNMQMFFENLDLDYEDVTILRREIHHEGKSRAFINDSPVTLTIMKQLAEQLIEIHSQHAALELAKPSFQLSVIDAMANNEAQLRSYKAVFSSLQKQRNALQVLEDLADKTQGEADYQQYLFQELNDANLQNDEQDILESEAKRLTHAEDIKQNLLESHHILHENERSVLYLLKDALRLINEVKEFDPELKEIHERLVSTNIELKDLSHEISAVADNTFVDQDRFQFVRDRLDLIFRLQQKHQVETIAELLDIQTRLDQQLGTIQQYDEQIKQLQEDIADTEKKAYALARELSQSRQQVRTTLQKQVMDNIAGLGIPHGQFQVDIHPLKDNRLIETGLDQVSFLFSANQGQSPQDISKVASGGELSRLMLTLKSIVATRTALPTIIFDEIDTGISGAVALKVGESMEALAKSMQVIAITHLPQIAAKGETHFKVSKEENQKRSVTHLTSLNPEERLYEIAELLGGTEIGETALEHAKQLLKR